MSLEEKRIEPAQNNVLVSTKKTIDWALSQKGEGSVTRVWDASKKASAQGDVVLASRLKNIARSKAAYAQKMKGGNEESGVFAIFNKTINSIFGS